MKSVAAIRHVPFEDLGSLHGVLSDLGYEVRYWDCGLDDVAALAPLSPDLVVILGGPIGAYDDAVYPVLGDELRLLDRRLREDLPTLGICLGAQLIARALGAKVYPGKAKEIGWAPLELTDAGRQSALRYLDSTTAVLHWHGDTFDLPGDATLLASTEITRHQAFAWGRNALALQFHAEATAQQQERWLIGHACELGGARIAATSLRADAQRRAGRLEVQARRLFAQWLSER